MTSFNKGSPLEEASVQAALARIVEDMSHVLRRARGDLTEEEQAARQAMVDKARAKISVTPGLELTDEEYLCLLGQWEALAAMLETEDFLFRVDNKMGMDFDISIAHNPDLPKSITIDPPISSRT